jgi:hypothetical protein
MSTRRIGIRAAVVGLGVLASLALMAAPSWAAKGGNSANAALCEPGGYPGALLNGHAEAFKNEGQCTKAGAHGELAGVNVVTGPVVVGKFTETCSGFGLKPASRFSCAASYGNNNRVTAFTVAADGTASGSIEQPCSFGRPTPKPVPALVVDATTAEGTLFGRTFLAPSGCSPP